MTAEIQRFQLPAPVSAGPLSSVAVFAQHPPASATLCPSGKRGTDLRCAGAAPAPLTVAPGPANVPTEVTDAPSALLGSSAHRPATAGGFRRLRSDIAASFAQQAAPAPAATAAAPATVTSSPCRVWRSPASGCGRSATATRFMKRFLMDDLLRERNAYAKRVMAEVRGRRRELETVE